MTDQTNGLITPHAIDFSKSNIIWGSMPATPVMTLASLQGNGAVAVNTIAETSLIDFLLPAGALRPDVVLKIAIQLHLADPGGGFSSLLKLKLGGTTIFQGNWTCPSLATYEVFLNWFIRNISTNNSQYNHINSFSAANGLQNPPANLAVGMVETAAVQSAIDTSIAEHITVTATNSATGLLRGVHIDAYSINLGF
jgi:hypothetical protein